MRQPVIKQTGVIEETVRGIVDRVTYHNSDNGFSILRVFPFNNPHQQETVVVHQTKVFAGATMEFTGLIFGSIGMGYMVYGRKQANFMALLAGVGLCVFPYFTNSDGLAKSRRSEIFTPHRVFAGWH